MLKNNHNENNCEFSSRSTVTQSLLKPKSIMKCNNPGARALSRTRMSNPSIRENLLCTVPQETTPSSPCPSSSSARYLRRDSITNERVAGIKVQRTTTAASGNPKADDEMQRTKLAGVDKKVRGL